MAVRRRIGFAAPLVVVVACGGAQVRTDPDEAAHRERLPPAPAPVVVAVAADPAEVAPPLVLPPDVPAPIVPEPIPPAPADACLRPAEAYRRYRVYCNPPPRPANVCADPAEAYRLYGITCNPPSPPVATPIEADVVDVQPDTVGARIVIAKGADDGLVVGMRGDLVVGQQKVRGSQFRLESVQRRHATARVKMTASEIRQLVPRVRIARD